MTERRGRSARWNTALVLVPGTAAMFGAAVAWAADTTPHPSWTPTSPVVAPTTAARTVDAQAVARHQRLERQIAAHRTHIKRLAQHLAALRAQAARVHLDPGPAIIASGPIGGGGGYGGGSSGGYSGGSSSGGGQLAPAPVQQTQAPAPPPVSATTGASGHP